MLKAIIFDYDDTLVQTRKTRYKTISNLALEEFKYKINVKEIDAAWGLPADDFLIKLFGKFTSDLNLIWKLYLEYSIKDKNVPHDSSFEFIEKYQKFLNIGIVTSSSEKVVLRELNELNINLDYFFFIQTSDYTNVHKPDPNVFLPINEKLTFNNIQKNEVIYIGDSPSDFYSSTKFGYNFLGIAHDPRYKDFFLNENINFVENFNDLEKYIVEMQNYA
ncbi:phosphatase [Leptospira biflexa serovar Patoc strain 'Patoc 1 (Ames)']|uniref:phosphoglycolate phosphatase n=1 Tax=Leptospira biflexa serovar Patoc (strain Patoc 1 / ATCC 23582 / Paris) TaxID=456481 RepID=B0ST80_LEPBP|nr:HAD-IA family hydrolase [Leptospira biflexa]ABZ94657.1 phosphatase [Leptospira biflexa serovar Patoc strain 'Patoc 1 (Ames)']ABZ98320.1 Putative hydrolase, HAD superfamily [Leptospira biflexa serovar Patoc strain 'Patoc 1 (Paris)']